MTISNNTLASARIGIDHAYEAPEVTEAMIRAGRNALAAGVGHDVDVNDIRADVFASVFAAMWGARRPAPPAETVQ